MCIGLHLSDGILRIALARQEKNQIVVEKIDDLPPVKRLNIVTGLDGFEVIRRDLNLPLKQESKILKTLPFQIETLIPLPPDDMIITTLLFPQAESTDIIIFATQRKSIQSHLEKYRRRGIDPDVVSCTAQALVRYAKWHFPSETNIALMQSGCAVICRNGKAVFAQPYDDETKMQALIRAKFPDVKIIENLDNHATAIGLALEGLSPDRLQFLQEEFEPSRLRQNKKSKILSFLSMTATITVFIASLLWMKNHAQERRLSQQLLTYNIPEKASLEEGLEQFENSLKGDKKAFPLEPPLPNVSEILAWISAQKHEVEIVTFQYRLSKMPTLEHPKDPYEAIIEIELKAADTAEIRKFQEALLKDYKPQDIQCTSSNENYLLTFKLR